MRRQCLEPSPSIFLMQMTLEATVVDRTSYFLAFVIQELWPALVPNFE